MCGAKANCIWFCAARLWALWNIRCWAMKVHCMAGGRRSLRSNRWLIKKQRNLIRVCPMNKMRWFTELRAACRTISISWLCRMIWMKRCSKICLTDRAICLRSRKICLNRNCASLRSIIRSLLRLRKAHPDWMKLRQRWALNRVHARSMCAHWWNWASCEKKRPCSKKRERKRSIYWKISSSDSGIVLCRKISRQSFPDGLNGCMKKAWNRSWTIIWGLFLRRCVRRICFDMLKICLLNWAESDNGGGASRQPVNKFRLIL